jgi:adenylate cyclase
VSVREDESPELGRLGRTFNQMVAKLAMAEQMERAFGLYTSTHLLDRIRSQHGNAALPGAIRDATVLFADIRGFTSLSERLPPEHVVAVLNRFFDAALDTIERFDGFVNKFVGDALMVVFNGPVDQGDHAERATRCAVALQQQIAALNAERAFQYVDALEVGVGIASGPMVCGNIGGRRQIEYTVIGDTVNMASRLCSAAAGGEVLVSGRTAGALPTSIDTRPLPPLQVKGKTDPVRVLCAWPPTSLRQQNDAHVPESASSASQHIH